MSPVRLVLRCLFVCASARALSVSVSVFVSASASSLASGPPSACACPMCAMLQQLMNKELAMKLLKSKLLAIAQQQKAQEIKDIKGGKLLSG